MITKPLARLLNRLTTTLTLIDVHEDDTHALRVLEMIDTGFTATHIANRLNVYRWGIALIAFNRNEIEA